MIPLAWFSCAQKLTNSVRNEGGVSLGFATKPLKRSATISPQVGRVHPRIMFLDYDSR